MACDNWIRTLVDRAQAPLVRIEAAQQLARECREYKVWQTLCAVAGQDDDVDVRCAVVRALPAWNRYAAINFLVRAFPEPRVRAAALETLEEIGPVDGEFEARLLATIENPPVPVDVANIPCIYGRDPRALAYLRAQLPHNDKQIRVLAVSGLCCLGEPETVLPMAADAEAEVRAEVCDALGFYREQRGVEVLKRLLTDADPRVARSAKKALRLLGQLEKAKPVKPKAAAKDSPWTKLLRDISKTQLAKTEIAVDVPDAMVEAEWLGEPGATEAQIAALEQRLGGVRLPPSYREFLAAANGFRRLCPFIWKLRGTEEIDWFRVSNRDWIEAYQHPQDDISPEEHRQAPLDSEHWRAAYLWSCLQISDEGDAAVVLLNPEVVTPEGEWEVWFFANWIPGAERFRSFRDYMEFERQRVREL